MAEWGIRIIKDDDNDLIKWLDDICKSRIDLGPSIEAIEFLANRTCKIWYADPKYV